MPVSPCPAPAPAAGCCPAGWRTTGAWRRGRRCRRSARPCRLPWASCATRRRWQSCCTRAAATLACWLCPAASLRPRWALDPALPVPRCQVPCRCSPAAGHLARAWLHTESSCQARAPAEQGQAEVGGMARLNAGPASLAVTAQVVRRTCRCWRSRTATATAGARRWGTWCWASTWSTSSWRSRCASSSSWRRTRRGPATPPCTRSAAAPGLRGLFAAAAAGHPSPCRHPAQHPHSHQRAWQGTLHLPGLACSAQTQAAHMAS